MPRTVYGRTISSVIRVTYGDGLKVFDTEIPKSVRASETSALGISIYAHAPNGKVARAYTSLIEEVLADE